MEPKYTHFEVLGSDFSLFGKVALNAPNLDELDWGQNGVIFSRIHAINQSIKLRDLMPA